MYKLIYLGLLLCPGSKDLKARVLYDILLEGGLSSIPADFDTNTIHFHETMTDLVLIILPNLEAGSDEPFSEIKNLFKVPVLTNSIKNNFDGIESEDEEEGRFTLKDLIKHREEVDCEHDGIQHYIDIPRKLEECWRNNTFESEAKLSREEFITNLNKKTRLSKNFTAINDPPSVHSFSIDYIFGVA